MTNYDELPEHMQSGAREYIEDGKHPGSFLISVLCNSLTESFSRADEINKTFLPVWVKWLVWDIPATAWGSEEKVMKWMGEKREEKRKRKREEVSPE